MVSHQPPAIAQVPPLVKGLPVLGNTLDAMRDAVGLIVHSYHTYGPVFRLRLLGKERVVIAGPDANLFAQQNERMLFEAPDNYRYIAQEAGTAHTLLTLEGEEHRHLRSEINLGFARQIIARQLPAMVNYVQTAARAWQPGQRLDVLETMSNLLMEQAGRSLLSHSLAEDDLKLFNTFSKTFAAVGVGFRPPLMLRNPAYQRGKRRFMDVMGGIYERHRRQVSEEQRGLDQFGVALQATHLNGCPLNRVEATANTYFSYIMNAVYTNRACAYLLYELLKNPSLMERVLAEIDAASADGDLSITVLDRMAVLRAAVRETLRLYPIAFATPRKVKQDFDFAGYHFRKGQRITLATTLTHFLPEFFPNPYTFDIDRFLPPRNEHKQPRVLLPFGLGTHACLGRNLSIVLTMTTIIGLLRSVLLTMDAPGYVAKRVANPLPGPEGFKVRVLGPRPLPPRHEARPVLEDEEAALLRAARSVDTLRREQLMETVERRVFNPGDTIIRQGDEADAFYILASGAVDVFLESSHRRAQHIDHLSAGAFFGEIGLLHKVRRTATVRVSGDDPVEVFVVDKETFTRFVADLDLTDAEIAVLVRQRMINMSLARALPTLERDDIGRLSASAEVQRYAPGEVIVRQGEEAEHFYILVRGHVEVTNRHPTGHDIPIDELGPGEYFGEIGLVQNRPRTATVRAGADEVEVVVLDREAFTRLMHESVATESAVARVMAQRLIALAA